MNAGQQQRVLQQITQALMQLVGGAGAGAMTVPALYTQFLPLELQGAPRDAFDYNIDFLTIAAGGGTDTGTFTVEKNSDFLIVYAAATVVDPAAEQTDRPANALTIEMNDTGSGRSVQNRASSFANVVGTGQLPCYWPYPKFLTGTSNFSVTVVNNAAANAVRVRLSFGGFKIFSYEG